jgi:hypothetical protein
MNTSALRDCKACGKGVSRHSPFCRQCGHPQGQPLVIWLVVLFFLMMVAFYFAFVLYGLCNVQELRVSGDSWSVEPGLALVVGLGEDREEPAEEEAGKG